MKKSYLLFIALIIFTSCTQRSCQKWEKSTQYSERQYEVHLFSGGDTVYTDKFRGIINGEEATDGFYYFKGDTLVEVSGDYVIKSVE